MVKILITIKIIDTKSINPKIVTKYFHYITKNSIQNSIKILPNFRRSRHDTKNSYFHLKYTERNTPFLSVKILGYQT